MAGVFDHLHIKRHTAGSSNELSFDVLDAARGNLDAKGKRISLGSHGIVPSRTSQGEYRAVGATTPSAQEEVSRRKRERRARSAKWLSVGVVLVVAVMVGTAYVGYDFYSDLQNFRQEFNEIIGMFEKPDEVLPEMDAFMADPFTTTSEDRESLRQAIASSEIRLDQIQGKLTVAGENALTDQDANAVAQVSQSLRCRKTMLEIVRGATLTVDNSVIESSSLAAVWNDVLDADQKARSATSSANKASTQDEIKQSKEITQEAKEQMELALTQVKHIQEENPELDLVNHLTYLELRIASFDHALQTSDALIAGDKATATYENDLYNEKDQEAVQVAESLPLSVEETVKDSFTKRVSALKGNYQTARDAAIDSDSLIRNYIG